MKSIYVSIFTSFASLLFTCSLAYASQPQASSSESLAEQQSSLIRYFFAAARTGESDVIKTFLNAGFPINQTNPQSYTALMVAAYHGQSDIVDTLLAHVLIPVFRINGETPPLWVLSLRGNFRLLRHFTVMNAIRICETKQA